MRLRSTRSFWRCRTSETIVISSGPGTRGGKSHSELSHRYERAFRASQGEAMRFQRGSLVSRRGGRREIPECSLHRRDTPRNRVHSATRRAIGEETRCLAGEAPCRVLDSNPPRERRHRGNLGTIDGPRSSTGHRLAAGGDSHRAWPDVGDEKRGGRSQNRSVRGQPV